MRIKITVPDRGKQNHRTLTVYDHDPKRYTEHSVICDVKGQNRLRQVMAIIRKHAFQYDKLDLSVMKTEDGKGFRLMTYTQNWTGRACYYAGIIQGVERIKRSRRKKRTNKSVLVPGMSPAPKW